MPADSGTMRFVPQGTPPPATDAPAGEGEGQTFYLVSYGPQGAEQPLIAGTQITASFADDVVTGNAGCNNYSGELTPVDDHFTVGPILTTRQICGEPAGVMEQEQAYLLALESTGGFRWEQTRSSSGELVTQGQLFYNMPDGVIGALNFTTSP
jgi:heat shock protein HslJ